MSFVTIIKYNKCETVLHICPFLASYLHGQMQNGSFTALFAITGAWARGQAGLAPRRQPAMLKNRAQSLHMTGIWGIFAPQQQRRVANYLDNLNLHL